MTKNKPAKKVRERKHAMYLDEMGDGLYYGLKIASEEHNMSMKSFAKMILSSYVDRWKVNDENIRKYTSFNK